MSEIEARIREWTLAPDGGVAFWDQANAIRRHDQSCGSLPHVWLPRLGSVTGLGDVIECQGGCEITFFWDGLVIARYDCPESDHWYCRCCRDKTDRCGC